MHFNLQRNLLPTVSVYADGSKLLASGDFLPSVSVSKSFIDTLAPTPPGKPGGVGGKQRGRKSKFVKMKKQRDAMGQGRGARGRRGASEHRKAAGADRGDDLLYVGPAQVVILALDHDAKHRLRAGFPDEDPAVAA